MRLTRFECVFPILFYTKTIDTELLTAQSLNLTIDSFDVVSPHTRFPAERRRLPAASHFYYKNIYMNWFVCV